MQAYETTIALCRYGILTLGLIGALYQDIRYLKIPNRITMPLLLIGLILAAASGATCLMDHLLGIALPFAIGFVLYALRMFGAGDVKFMMALGALMGKEWIVNCMIASILCGGVLAVIVMLYRGILWERLKYAGNYFVMLFLTRKLAAYQVLDNQQKQFFPFAIAIACGSVLACIGWPCFF